MKISNNLIMSDLYVVVAERLLVAKYFSFFKSAHANNTHVPHVYISRYIENSDLCSNQK